VTLFKKSQYASCTLCTPIHTSADCLQLPQDL
jgi:hypothetical protein